MATKNILREHLLRDLLLIVFTGTLTAATLVLLTILGHIILLKTVKADDTSTATRESLLFMPKNSFLQVAEASGVVKGYGVSTFHQLHDNDP
ncbi:hypothetical protein MMC31_004006, partial [Peltigera leucophlebia]|nr:hypothetical protein [Peltigera leucophlebia]